MSYTHEQIAELVSEYKAAESAIQHLNGEISELSTQKAKVVAKQDEVKKTITEYLIEKWLKADVEYFTDNGVLSLLYSEAVIVPDSIDLSILPSDLVRIPEPKPAPDKTAIKKYLKKDENSLKEFWVYIERRANLQVK